MKTKEFSILILLYTLVLGLSACAEPSTIMPDNMVVEADDYTSTPFPTEEPEEPVITLVPTPYSNYKP